jgi:hypothetical protein
MKKLLLSLVLVTSAFAANSQVICAIQSPSSIAGNYNFTWADPPGGWGTPDFLIPGTFIEDTLVLVNDSTPGTNTTYGNLLSEEGCNPSDTNAYLGKIVVIRRNTCEFGTKALYAQNAGAVGVIIINRDPDAIGMGPGADGANVTIPVVMLSSTDGNAILQQMLSGPVVAFIGNKAGLYSNDAGMTKGTTLISKSFGVLSQLSHNGTEFNFELGTRIYNYGTSDQNNITLTASIKGPNGASVYNNSVNSISIVSGDSLDVYPGETYALPPFSLASYPAGRYRLTYTLSLGDGTTDEYTGDNTISSDFVINDSILSYAALDTVTNLPAANAFYKPATKTGTYNFSACMAVKHPNASNIGVWGVYFSATTSDSTVLLTGEEMNLRLYRWDDPFADLNDTANLAFNQLNLVAEGYYYYPSDLQEEVVLGMFDNTVLLENNQRYLACVLTYNTNIYMGHDSRTNYTWNVGTYLEPLFPNQSYSNYYAIGFGDDLPSALGLKVFSASELGATEVKENVGLLYPNPASDLVTISLQTLGNGHLTVTDLSGKIILNQPLSLSNGKSQIDIASFESGMYLFNVSTEDGQSNQFRVVKK